MFSLQNIAMRPKLIGLFLLVGLLPLFLVAWISSERASVALMEQTANQLVAVREIKKDQIERYLKERVSDVEVLVSTVELLWRGANAGLEAGKSRSVEEALAPILKEKSGYFFEFMEKYQYLDLMLLNPNGYLFYSVSKESDWETNLIDGQYAHTNHGRLIRQVMQSKAFGMVDFEPYPPSQNRPSAFIALPLVVEGKVLLVISLQLPLETINAIMQHREGMGQTGESYLVGPDKLMRSDSQEDPVHHSVNASFAGTVAKNGVDTEGIRRALAGESGLLQTEDYRQHPVLSAFAPIRVGTLNWAILAEMDLAEVQAPIHALRQTLLLAAVVLMGVVVGTALLTARTIANPLRQLMLAVDRIAKGDWSSRAEVSGRDELGQLARSFNQMAQNNEDQFWIKSKAAEFATIVQTSTSPEMFAQGVIRKLTPLLEGGHGVLYVWDAETQRYRLLGAYGYKERKNLSNEFALGVGLVGQCALEKEPILQTHVPADYIQINSGLGESQPLTLLVVPLIFQEQVLAVIEIASFHRFTPTQQALLEALSPTLGLGLENQNRTRRTEALLEETRAQAQEMTTLAEELQSQQEELNQSNQVLEEKNRALRASEEEMKMQREEIQANNTVLEARTRQLESQKSALEQSQQEIATKAAELAQASRYKSEFLANMSHELRNPLNSLLILAKQLASNEEGNLTESQVRAARIVHNSGQDLLVLINDILDLAKIESGKLELNMDAVDIRGFAEQIDQMFQHTAMDKGIAWKVEVAEDLPGTILTDGGKLGQIVKNLISNAIKFTERGMVSVRFYPLADVCTLAIRVTDTGIGIPADKRDLIFEAFRQADGSTTRRFGGTGLGLSISKELATLLGGDIRVESTEGKGSTFTLCLMDGTMAGTTPPAVDGSAPPKPVPMTWVVKDDREVVVPEDRAILVIEDDPVFAEILCGLAHKKQFKCLIASDGGMGLELASRYQPHGIILDLGLPGHLDGMMVMDRLKANPATRAIPVHIISGTDRTAEGLAKGAVRFLTKPVSSEQLDLVFQEVLSSAEMEGGSVLIVESDGPALQALLALVQTKTTHITTASSGEAAFALLRQQAFDCMILNPDLPDTNGCDLLDRIHLESGTTKPRVIVYTDKKLSRQEDGQLRKYTDSIVVKGARSDRRLQQEVDLFLSVVKGEQGRQHRQESRVAQDQEAIFAGKKILIVDDDMRNTYALASALSARGLKTEIADNGIWALKKLEEHPDVSVVLMDIMMPEMDGYQTMAEIRKQERFQDLPIIAITAKAMAEDRAKCLQAGANDYLSKPLDMERLFSLLRVWLKG